MDKMIGEVQTYVTRSDISPEDIVFQLKMTRSKYFEKKIKINKLFTMDELFTTKIKIHSDHFVTWIKRFSQNIWLTNWTLQFLSWARLKELGWIFVEDLNFSLFLTQNHHMTSEDLEYSSRVVQMTFLKPLWAFFVLLKLELQFSI